MTTQTERRPGGKRALGFALFVIAALGKLVGIFRLGSGHEDLLQVIHVVASLAILAAAAIWITGYYVRLTETRYVFRAATGPEETTYIDNLLKASYEGNLYPADEQIRPLLKKNRWVFRILEAHSPLSKLLNLDPAVGIAFFAPLVDLAAREFLVNDSFRGLDLKPSDIAAPGEQCAALYIGFVGIQGLRRRPNSRRKRRHADQLVREIKKLLDASPVEAGFEFRGTRTLINRPNTVQGINAAIKGGFRNAFPFDLSRLPADHDELKRLLDFFDRDSRWLQANGWSRVGPHESIQGYENLRDLANAVVRFGRSFGRGPLGWKQAEAYLTEAKVLNTNYIKELTLRREVGVTERAAVDRLRERPRHHRSLRSKRPRGRVAKAIAGQWTGSERKGRPN